MTKISKLNKNLILAIIMLPIAICLPLFIHNLLIKRGFQIIFLMLMSLSLAEVVREKIVRKENINYLNIIIVITFGIFLYVFIKRYG